MNNVELRADRGIMRPRTNVILFVALVALLIGLLIGRTHAAAPPVKVPVTTSVSKPGISVDMTTSVQRKLRSYGYSVAVDGVYGPQTTGAVRAWQHANGLSADGIAGTATQRSLGLTEASPATVAAPAVRVSPPVKTLASPPLIDGDVQAIIRDVWPDNLEGWALGIAHRESRFVPTVHNSCCWGIFQINWTAHHAWLCSGMGICDPQQLLDPRTNAEAALTLYQATGPGPWAL